MELRPPATLHSPFATRHSTFEIRHLLIGYNNYDYDYDNDNDNDSDKDIGREGWILARQLFKIPLLTRKQDIEK